jgi:hypothetical protein
MIVNKLVTKHKRVPAHLTMQCAQLAHAAAHARTGVSLISCDARQQHTKQHDGWQCRVVVLTPQCKMVDYNTRFKHDAANAL